MAGPNVNEDDIRVALRFLGNDLYELRINDNGKWWSPGWSAGEPLVERLASESGKHAKLCVTLQALKPEVEYLDPRSQVTTNVDVDRYTNLLIDVDAATPVKGIPSNEEEHAAALAVAEQVRVFLAAQGWGEPLAVDSGNGAGNVYRTDLPADKDSQALYKRFIGALEKLIAHDGASFDTQVTNPARIWGVPGTMNMKGVSDEVRPHRLSRVLSYPDSPVLVTEAMMRAVIALAEPEPERKEHIFLNRPDHGTDPVEWLIGWFDRFNIERKERDGRDSTHAYDVSCPNADEHTTEDGERDTTVFVNEHDCIAFVCQHSHCEGFDWEWYRAQYDEDYRLRLEIEGADEEEGDEDEDDDDDGISLLDLELRYRKMVMEHLLPFCELTLLTGEEEQGKTTAAESMAAGVTNGTLEGDFKGVPGSVMFTSSEQDPQDVKGTLIACEANLSLVRFFDSVSGSDKYIAAWLEAKIDKTAEKTGVPVRLVIIDGIKDYFQGKGENYDWDDAQVRKFLTKVMKVAKSKNVAILAILHPKKGQKTGVSGSRAWTTKPRTMLAFEQNKRIYVDMSNLGHKDEEVAIRGQKKVVGKDAETGKDIWAWYTTFGNAGVVRPKVTEQTWESRKAPPVDPEVVMALRVAQAEARNQANDSV